MSQENVETVRRYLDAMRAGDFEGYSEVTSPDVRLYPRREEAGVKDCYEGVGGIVEYSANWLSCWEDYDVEPERFIDADDWVVVDLRETGVAAKSGIRVEENFAHAFRVDNGKVIEWRMFGPLREALEAIGISE